MGLRESIRKYREKENHWYWLLATLPTILITLIYTMIDNTLGQQKIQSTINGTMEIATQMSGAQILLNIVYFVVLIFTTGYTYYLYTKLYYTGEKPQLIESLKNIKWKRDAVVSFRVSLVIFVVTFIVTLISMFALLTVFGLSFLSILDGTQTLGWSTFIFMFIGIGLFIAIQVYVTYRLLPYQSALVYLGTDEDTEDPKSYNEIIEYNKRLYKGKENKMYLLKALIKLVVFNLGVIILAGIVFGLLMMLLAKVIGIAAFLVIPVAFAVIYLILIPYSQYYTLAQYLYIYEKEGYKVSEKFNLRV